MKQVTTYLNAVEQHIDSSFDLGSAMQAFTPVFNKMKAPEQLEVRSNIARIISIKKKVAYVTIEAGAYKDSLGFKAKHKGGSATSEQARVMLAYYMPSKVEKSSTPKKAGKVAKKVVSKLDKLVKEFEALSKAEQAKFLRVVGK